LTNEEKKYIAQQYRISNKNLVDIYFSDMTLSDLNLDLDNYENLAYYVDEKYMISYQDILTLLKVFNEDLLDLEKK